MSNQLFFEQEPDTLRPVVLVGDWVGSNLYTSQSPFIKDAWWRTLLVGSVKVLVRFLEKILRKELYIENELGEIAIVDVRCLRLLQSLLNERIITSWQFNSCRSDVPFVALCELKSGSYRLPSGRLSPIQGDVYGGVGPTLQDALLPALAEAIERHATCVWKERDLMVGTFRIVPGAVDQRRFVSFTPEQQQELSHNYSQVDEDTELRWVSAQHLTSGKRVRVPAQLVYLNFNREYSREPFLRSGTSNGTAAGVGFEMATVAGLNELVERDAFLLYWLNRLTPERIDLASIEDSQVVALIQQCEEVGYEIILVNTSSDIGVPVVSGFMIDRVGSQAVTVGAAAAFNPVLAVRKVVYDLVRWLHYHETYNNPDRPEAVVKTVIDINTFKQRLGYWSNVTRINEIEWMFKGKLVSIEDLQRRHAETVMLETHSQRLNYYRHRMATLQYDCYVVDITTSTASRAGLNIVRIVSEDLVPIYFNEREKPLACKRIYSGPVLLGRQEELSTAEKLNPYPHPFI